MHCGSCLVRFRSQIRRKPASPRQRRTHAQTGTDTDTDTDRHARAHANADPSFHTPQTHSAAQHTLTYTLCHVGKAGRSGGVTTTTFVVHVSFVWFSLHTMSSTATQGSCGKCIAVVESFASVPRSAETRLTTPKTHTCTNRRRHRHRHRQTRARACKRRPLLSTHPRHIAQLSTR